jgi:PEGA domain
MSRTNRAIRSQVGMLFLSVLVMAASAGIARAQASRGSAWGPAPAPSHFGGQYSPGVVNSYFYPSGGYPGFFGGGYFSPFLDLPFGPPGPTPQANNYWWTGMYGESSDPRGVGYNPRAGYSWDSVGTLILNTTPAKARVTLDGTYIGQASYLGPIQLPFGDHTLQIDALGYETSTHVIHVDAARTDSLDVRLKSLVPTVGASLHP